MRSTAIYIDGFNLYYGSLKGTPYRWLDLDAVAKRVLHNDNAIRVIKYFTAMVDGRIDPDGQKRQKIYLKALAAHTPHLQIYYGQFLAHPTLMRNADPPPAMLRVIKTEEKGSDVNLAVHFVRDAFLDEYDVGVIISNDGDLKEAVKVVRDDIGKTTGVILPLREGRRASAQLSKAPHFVRRLRETAVANSQLPRRIPGTKLFKPNHWN